MAGQPGNYNDHQKNGWFGKGAQKTANKKKTKDPNGQKTTNDVNKLVKQINEAADRREAQDAIDEARQALIFNKVDGKNRQKLEKAIEDFEYTMRKERW